jgi:hypothetical protein
MVEGSTPKCTNDCLFSILLSALWDYGRSYGIHVLGVLKEDRENEAEKY